MYLYLCDDNFHENWPVLLKFNTEWKDTKIYLNIEFDLGFHDVSVKQNVISCKFSSGYIFWCKNTTYSKWMNKNSGYGNGIGGVDVNKSWNRNLRLDVPAEVREVRVDVEGRVQDVHDGTIYIVT